jgi:hypothetical protein
LVLCGCCESTAPLTARHAAAFLPWPHPALRCCSCRETRPCMYPATCRRWRDSAPTSRSRFLSAHHDYAVEELSGLGRRPLTNSILQVDNGAGVRCWHAGCRGGHAGRSLVHPRHRPETQAQLEDPPGPAWVSQVMWPRAHAPCSCAALVLCVLCCACCPDDESTQWFRAQARVPSAGIASDGPREQPRRHSSRYTSR